MRISWLTADVVSVTRNCLVARHADWAVHFLPEFAPPPPPPGIDAQRWPQISEHVARAERVSQEIRDRGLAAAIACFGDSRHAVEQATLIAAAAHIDDVSYELLVSLFECPIDEFIAYGQFLEFLHGLSGYKRQQAVSVYERFCEIFANVVTSETSWCERVRSVRDGLASFYVSCGHYDKAHALFLHRHDEEPETVLVAISASRVFWAADELRHALIWLGKGIERAESLGRHDMARRLRDKQTVLRRRQRE